MPLNLVFFLFSMFLNHSQGQQDLSSPKGGKYTHLILPRHKKAGFLARLHPSSLTDATTYTLRLFP